MKTLFHYFVIVSLIVIFSLIAVTIFAKTGWYTTTPSSSLATEMNLHLEQVTAHIDQVEQDLATEKGVNVESLQMVLVELTLAQRVLNEATDQERANLGYQFSHVTLDEINHLYQLSLENQDQENAVLKAFIQATTYILQEVIQDIYAS